MKVVNCNLRHMCWTDGKSFTFTVSPHQDSTFLHTDPMRIVGFWFALEDVTLENGCLWFIPGSHKQGISRRFIRNPDPSSPNLTIYTNPNPDYDDKDFIPGPVSKGV